MRWGIVATPFIVVAVALWFLLRDDIVMHFILIVSLTINIGLLYTRYLQDKVIKECNCLIAKQNKIIIYLGLKKDFK